MKLTTIFLLMFLPLIANANYLKIAGSFNSKTEVEVEDTGMEFELDKNSLHPFLVALGMSIGPVTIELEGSYRSNPTSSVGEFTATNLGFNVAIDLTHRRFIVNPYVGGGAVAALYELQPQDETGFGVASQFFTGLNFKLNKYFSIGAEVRHYATFKHPTFEDSGGGEVILKHKQTYYLLSGMLYF